MQAEASYWRRVRTAREDFVTFAELAGKDARGATLKYGVIHRAWAAHVDYCWTRGLHALILSPFGTGKSSGFMVPLSTWLIGRDVQTRIKFVSNGDAFAMQRLQAAKGIMESPEYRAVFPHVVQGDKWTDHEMFVRREGNSIDPTLHARGVETKGIGTRADKVFFDDACDQDNSMSDASRKKVKERVDQTWMTRMEMGKGLALWIATPWHVDDATHAKMRERGWCTLVVRVNQNLTAFEAEVLGAGPDYRAATVPAWGPQYSA